MPSHSTPDHIELIARAVITHGDHVLVCVNTRAGFAYLPGGHVEPGEPAAVALARELVEECGMRVRVGRLLLVAETAFHDGEAGHHEVNLMFHVEQLGRRRALTSPPPTVRSREKHIDFAWVRRRDLADADIRPAELRDWLLKNWPSRNRPSRAPLWMSAMPKPRRATRR